MSNGERQEKPRWRRAEELPPDVFAVWQKSERAINPVAIVATVDEDGWPRTAPFGSLRAVTPKRLRLISARYHDTYANLARDGRVMVCLIAPPDIAASVRGRAKVVREQMEASESSAIVDIDVEEVKNDMVRTGGIDGAIAFSPWAEVRHWFEAVIGEAEDT